MPITCCVAVHIFFNLRQHLREAREESYNNNGIISNPPQPQIEGKESTHQQEHPWSLRFFFLLLFITVSS